jgi:uncharacterized membrane protein YhaH (DUF805 family)
MGGQTELAELFFSAQGRLSRTPFVVASLVLILAGLIEHALPSVLHWITGWVVYPALFFCGACLLSKRLHDRGRTGWFAALILFALAVVWPLPRGFLGFPFSLVVLWAVIELGLMAGEQGANRYGPNPLRQPAVA